MFKNLVKIQYHWHSFLHRYHAKLMNDCLCNEIRTKLQGKAAHHKQKVNSLSIKM